MLERVSDWAADIVGRLGEVGVALLVALENLFPPIPSEVVLGMAGYSAAQGDASMFGMVAASTAGSVTGALGLYGVSAAVGPSRLRALVIRYGKWFGLNEQDLDRAEAWFDRRSRATVLVCRCIPLIRSLISIPAGFRRMPLPTFTVFTLIGSAIWNVTLISAGYFLAERWDQLLVVAEPAQSAVLIVMGAAVAVFALRRGRAMVLNRRVEIPSG